MAKLHLGGMESPAVTSSGRSDAWPGWREVLPVYSIIVFVVFTWTIYRMAWQMQSWLFSNSLPQVLILAAYVLAFAGLESLAVLAFVLLLRLALPARWLRVHFVAQASALILVLSGLAVWVQNHQELLSNLAFTQVIAYPLALLAGVLVFLWAWSNLLERVPPAGRLLAALAERLTVFAYVYVPVSLLGWLVIIARNLR